MRWYYILFLSLPMCLAAAWLVWKLRRRRRPSNYPRLTFSSIQVTILCDSYGDMKVETAGVRLYRICGCFNICVDPVDGSSNVQSFIDLGMLHTVPLLHNRQDAEDCVMRAVYDLHRF